MLKTIKSTTKMAKKRVPPVFRLLMKNGAKLEQVYNHPQIQNIVIEQSVLAIKEGIFKKKDCVILFQIGDSDYDLEINREEWPFSLQKALDYYCDKEDYNKCAEIRDLISKL